MGDLFRMPTVSGGRGSPLGEPRDMTYEQLLGMLERDIRRRTAEGRNTLPLSIAGVELDNDGYLVSMEVYT